MATQNLINKKLRKMILPEDAEGLNHGLLYWQYEFFYLLNGFSIVGGSIGFLFGLLWYVTKGYSFLIPVVSILFITLLLITFVRKTNFKIRRIGNVSLFLCFGIFFLFVDGYQGLGLSLLLAYPIVTAVLLGPKHAVNSLLFDALMLVGLNLLLNFNAPFREQFTNYVSLFWIAVSFTFMVLTTLLTLAVSRLLAGLDESLRTETMFRQNLESEMVHSQILQEALFQERNSLQIRVDKRTAELIASNTELQDAMKFKDIFLATVSHELRTPIHAITGYSHLLQKSGTGIFTEKQTSYLERMNDSSQHLLQVVNDILDITRIQAGKLDLKKELIPLQESCEGAAYFVRPEALKKNIQVNINFQEPVSSIQADPQRFKQILINLLGNAVKFTPVNGLVGITVDRKETTTLIAVWDTGIGISEEEQEKVFNTFYRSSNAAMVDVQGTGLGLPLVKNLVEAHGWKIRYESKKDEGSTFTICIPQEPLPNPVEDKPTSSVV